MAITKESVIDKVEVLENGTLQVRRADIIKEDGNELTRSFHRHVLVPGSDTTSEDAKVIAIAEAVWTEDVINDYLESLN
jgi:hypothetical protein